MSAKQKRGCILILVGILMLMGALTIHLTQERQDRLAGENSRILLEQLKLSRVTIPLEEKPVPENPASQPETEDEGESLMAEKEYLGYSMIGTLRVPACGVELPILSTWSYELLNVAPCRYSGSIPEGNMILMGHNYSSQFTPLHQISIGALVEFEDVNGLVYSYTVADIEYLHKTDADRLPSEHPLTLFTCTASGQNRFIIRCDNAEE